MSDTPRLVIVDVVTREHGEKFAEAWRELSMGSEPMLETFQETGVAVWPDDPDLQGLFMEIQDEVTERVFDAIRYAAVKAFVRIASEVLARERGNQSLANGRQSPRRAARKKAKTKDSNAHSFAFA